MIKLRLFLLFEKLLMVLPRNIRKKFFTSLGFLAYYLSPKYKKISLVNLDFLFGDTMSKDEKIEITKYSFKNLLLNFFHLMELRHTTKDELRKKITIQNEKVVQDAIEQKRAIVFVTTHYCSWELGGASIGAFVKPLAAVYRKMKNATFQDWLLDARSSFGNTNLEMHGVAKSLVKIMRSGGACGILIDTNLNKNEGTLVDFMGKKINQTPTPAYMARKFGAAIIPVTIRTDDEETYTLMFFDEIKVQTTNNEDEDIQKATQLQADWLSNLIKKEPKFWFWVHRRFKSDYPKIYQE